MKNNKGYMLIEIILASVLAFAIAYFIMSLTIKLKNKNNDLMVNTAVTTDQTIISNILMSAIYKEGSKFSCNDIKIEGNVFKYKDKKNILSGYASFDGDNDFSCIVNNYMLSIKIPINVPLATKNYDIDIYHQFGKNLSCESINDSLCCGEQCDCENQKYGLCYNGTQSSCQFIYDSPEDDQCRVKFLTSGKLFLASQLKVDVFLVGGGYGGGSSGGAGGYAKTIKNFIMPGGVNYNVTIGKGGGGVNECGGGGGLPTASTIVSSLETITSDGGSRPAYEFGETSSGVCYAGSGGTMTGWDDSCYFGRCGGSGSCGGGASGGGYYFQGNPGGANTGGGGGGYHPAGDAGCHYAAGASGGSGIVIIRNHQT